MFAFKIGDPGFFLTMNKYPIDMMLQKNAIPFVKMID